MAKRQITADKRWDITVENNNINKNKTQSVLLWALIQYENLLCFSAHTAHIKYIATHTTICLDLDLDRKGTDINTDTDEGEERLLAFNSIKQMCAMRNLLRCF